MRYRFLLLLLGSYYVLSGIWSIIDIEGFSRFTGYEGDFFLKHVNGVLFTSLGLFYIIFSFRDLFRPQVLLLSSLTALSLALVDLYYLPKIGNPLSFWIDFLVESGFFFALLFAYVFNRGKNP